MAWFCAVLFGLLSGSAAAQALLPLDYSQLASWEQQDHSAALNAFQTSCKAPINSRGIHAEQIDVNAWRRVCGVALQTLPSQAKQFFEQQFQPQQIAAKGFITGYYIPLLEGSLRRHGAYQWPVYAVPDDFQKPYLTRAEIEAGGLKGRGLELVWLNDSVMRFFLHIQGSGHVKLPDGRIMSLLYAAKNERPYTAIGRVLIKQGHLTKETVSLQTIREYLYANPERQRDLFNQNESYVFFSLKQEFVMPKGAQGVPLTAGHSLAIDPAFWPYGLPMMVQTDSFSRLTIMQDTGSAIKGKARGDLFVGLGKSAEALAGTLATPSKWVILVPKP